MRRSDGEEIEVSLEEVRKLGEDDSGFRKSIVTSKETLNTIVDASIRQLQRIRAESGDRRHKIIASALNYEHCRQVVEAFRSRGLAADYVHSREDSKANDKVMSRLEDHKLDVIVQVRKLGEGFDHPFLSVAAVCSLFANLSPFVQFVGRIMRVVEQNNPSHPSNQGVVVFHAGGNVLGRWEDFKDFSAADQEYFENLLATEQLNFGDASELTNDPSTNQHNHLEVRHQSGVSLEEIPLIENDEQAMAAIGILRARGYSAEDVKRAMELQPVPTTKVKQRQAARTGLEMRCQTAVGRILGRRGIPHEGHQLDAQRLGRTNFVVMKSAIDRQVNQFVGRTSKQRHEFSKEELERIDAEFDKLASAAEEEVFGA